jgi:hypothetical protein
MSSIGAAPRAADSLSLSPARVAASRRNGAKSRGPKTAEGKARSSQNALKHGLRAQKHMVLPGESSAAFEALEAALLEELAPQGALQTVLARRVVAAAWRLERAEHLEAGLFAWNQLGGAGRNLGLALTRDCNNARAFDTLLRYRGGTLAEFWRALRTLKALQAEQARALATDADQHAPSPEQNEPETRMSAGASVTRPAAAEDTGDRTRASPMPAVAQHTPHDRRGLSLTPPALPSAPSPRAQPRQPNEPEVRSSPGESADKQPRGDGPASLAVPPSLRPAVGAGTPGVA